MFEDFQLEIPSDINSIAPAVDKIVAQIRESQCLAGSESDVEVALFEALANAVIHGNREEKSKSVRVVCRLESSDRVSIVVRDQGTGFDPGAVPDPTRPENLGAEHGRGILMMKTFMDEVHFERGGTEVHMTKNCHRAAVKKAAP
jgi:serine/threonine-protein kinase RsbW